MSSTAKIFASAKRWPFRKQFLVYGVSTVLVGSAVTACCLVDSFEDVRQLGLLRFGRAAAAVAQIVVDYKLSLRGFLYSSEEYNKAIKECHKRSALRLLDLACDNGGVFIKVGQHLSAMEFLIPTEYTTTLSILTSKAPEASYEDIVYVVESELGKKISDVFSEFSEKPVGAASLAQVHIAKLKNIDQKVAVKVQHRRVYKNSRTDMNTMEFLVKVADKVFPEFKLMCFSRFQRFTTNIPHLDYLRWNFARVHILTISHYMMKNNINTHDVCRKLGKLYSEMIFINGKTSGDVDIVLLDHGLYLDIDDRIRSLYTDLWLALLGPDQEKLRIVAKEMGVGDLYGLLACIVSRRTWQAVSQGIKNKKMDNNERSELRLYAASLIPQIKNRADSFVEMSKCVVRSHYQMKLKNNQRSIWEAFRLRLRLLWALFKIYAYEWYLITTNVFSSSNAPL
ncbi:hypothetical protein KIN20_021688 [Parelaphostrongylus tenuis]|uniref:ABC1 atypical kinase-like domain-containing protein n=1 Tax=Parelaphostrongylus tenuis TaxID=148309 RepID=A0AAD5MT26_PARTN|nr:hypothetical protein KIN20_021688 [Parelaphostrongylus tenuis]